MKAQEGIYALFQKGELVYIGKSNNLLYRVGTHMQEGVKSFDSYEMFPVDRCDEKQLTKIEAELITTFQPKYNATYVSYCRRIPIFGKENTIAYIRTVVKQMSAESCEMRDRLGRLFCLCGDCAYYYKNVDKNKRLCGRNKMYYKEKCCMRGSGAWWGADELDGCSRGLPIKYADVYQDNRSRKDQLIQAYDEYIGNKKSI